MLKLTEAKIRFSEAEAASSSSRSPLVGGSVRGWRKVTRSIESEVRRKFNRHHQSSGRITVCYELLAVLWGLIATEIGPSQECEFICSMWSFAWWCKLGTIIWFRGFQQQQQRVGRFRFKFAFSSYKLQGSRQQSNVLSTLFRRYNCSLKSVENYIQSTHSNYNYRWWFD